jgi:hypothetical protein
MGALPSNVRATRDTGLPRGVEFALCVYQDALRLLLV